MTTTKLSVSKVLHIYTQKYEPIIAVTCMTSLIGVELLTLATIGLGQTCSEGWNLRLSIKSVVRLLWPEKSGN